MKKFIFCFVWIVAVTADSYDFGSCAALQDPVASHPRYGHDVKAGSLEVFEKDGEIVARPICDNEQGFILINDRFTEMRCSYNPYTGKWTWNHHHRDRRAPPLVRCAHVSPKPRVQRFRLGASFTGCSDPLSKEETLSAFEERLTSSLPCFLTDECTISDLSCEATESDTVLSVKITSMSTRKVMEQQLMLETAAEYLRSSPLHSLVTSQSGRSGRVKRFDPSGFDDATTEDVDTSGCGAGYITNADETCTQCTAGTYPDTAASPQVCASCAYDTYRSDLAANECTACGAGLGTLEEGSDAVADCIAICTVPTMKFVASTSPESRVADGGNVEMTCAEGYSYGNSGTRTVVCSSLTNNFPASCRKVTVSATQASVKAGDNGALSCVVEAHDVGTAIQWFKGEDVAALTSDGSAYTIATTLATAFEADGITKKSTSSLSILAFDSDDVASYSCRIDYADPILDDNSPEQALAILDLTVTPSTAQIVSEAASLQLSCAMNLDSTYSTRTVTWKLNSGADITTGVTTSTSSSAYTSVLSLSSVAIADAGTYTCTATYALSDGSGPVVLTGTVDVTVRGFETHPTAMNVDIGSQIVISCVTVGDQQPSISWKKGETVVSGDVDTYDDGTKKTTSTLTIASATSDDSGDYKCTADFGGTTIESNVATVNVYDIGITVNPVDTAHLVGEDAVLSCMVKNPEGATPSLSWIKVGDTETVQDNANINFDNANPGKSTLTFTSATIEQAGVYKCQAVYVIGEQQITRTSTTANLFIRELSKELDEYTGVTALGGSQTFTCEYHGDNAVSGVAWTYNDGVLPTGYSITQQGSYSTSTSKWESVLTVNPIIKSSGGAVKCTFSFTGTGADISSTSNFRVRYVAPLTAEAVSSAAAYTVTCNYQGTDDPSVSWTVGGSVVSNSDEGITITEGSLASNDRSDKLTISGRTYSDASKAITCKYSFTNPTAELTANTVLKFRGLNAGLNAKYYSTGDAVTMECSLGVGSDGSVPSETAWFHNYADVSSIGLVNGASYDIVTDASVTNGLFKSTLTIKAAGITTANSGNYRCQFKISESEAYHSEGALVVRLVTISPSDANIYSYANAGLQLSCTLDASDSKSGITWTGPGGTIDASKYSNDEGNANIHIVSLDGTAASGEYKCTFAFTEGSSTVPEGVFSNVNLNLLEMTSPAALYSTYGAGVSVTLTCQVTSPSQLTLTFHDGSTDLPATTTKYEGGKTIAEYTITVDAANKGGTFQCRKSATETSTTSTTLTVLSMATPPASPTRANDGVTVTISCVAQSHADVTPPTFSWLKDGSAVTETPEADVVALDGSTVTSKLPIVVSSANDGSVYKCVATYTGLAAGTNLESSTTVTMNKIVPSSLVTVSTFVGEAATLSCVATAADGVDIKWRKKATGWTAESPTYDALTGSQDAYDVGAGTRTSTLTYSSPVTSDSSDSVECYDSTVGITAVMALEVIGTTAVNQEVKSGQQAVISCQVDGLLSVLDSVAWKKSTGETISGAMADFEIADGAYTSATKSQTTTLTVKNGINTADTTYKCAVTRGAQTRETEVSLKVFTVTSTPKQVTTAVDQTLTCTIGELDASGTPVTVTWKDSSDATVSNSDTSNYVLVEGTVDGSGEQNAVLTIKSAKLASYSAQASFTYKCSVQYSGSPASTEIDVVANVLTFGVTAVDQQQLKDTEAKISCTVDGLTTALNGVKWTKADDTEITSGSGGFVIEAGTLSGNTQTTILTVPASDNTLDTTYKCLITSTEHGKTEDSTSVSLKVFTVTSTPKQVTTAVDQTLTCTIGELDASGTPVTVTWKDSSDATVSNSDTSNYVLVEGTVSASGEQNAELTIKAAKLASYSAQASFTYKCSVQYSGSPASTEKDVVANVLTFGVTAVGQEQLKDTEAKISCTVDGLTTALNGVKWTKSDNTQITSGIDGFVVVDGTLSGNSQTTILTVPAAMNIADATYNCLITSTEHGKLDESTSVSLKIFSLSELDVFYYSPPNVELTVEGRYEPEIAWSINGQSYSQSNNPNLTPTVKTAWDGSKKAFNLAFAMGAFPADMAPFTVSATISLGDASSATFPVGPFKVYKREFSQSLPVTVTLIDEDFPKEFDCAAQGESKDLFSLSWRIGSTTIDGDFTLASITDTSEASSATEKKSKLTIPANNPTFNDELKCVATWTGDDAKEVVSMSDINAIGASMAAQTFSDGASGDGIMTCLVWGDAPPHSVSWQNPNEETISDVANEIVIASSTVGSVHTHTLTLVDMSFGDEGKYTCTVVIADGDTPRVLVTELSKLSASFVPSSPYFVHDNAVAFTCVYNGLEDPSQVEWFKGSTDDASTIITAGDKYGIELTEFNIASRSKSSVITFKNVAVTDSGDYTCKWHTTSFDPKSTMTVAIRSLTTPSAMTYSTDGSIKVTCNYEGTTSGTMEWFYKNQKLVDAEGDDITIDDGTLESNAQKYTLTIANVNPESNSGEYKCALSFSDGDKLEATTDVEVRKATAIDTAGAAESSIVVSDGTMSARCLFEGDKVPSSVTWSKGGSNIEFDSLKKIQNTNTKQLDNSIKFFSNITLKEFAFADQGSYTCTFVFADGNNVEASVNAISASITNDECVFVDYRTESSKALTCTYHGSDQVTGVSFTMPDNTAQTGQLGAYAAGGDADTAGTQTGTYTVTGITAASSGAYTCTFTLSDGSTVSAIQRLTARKAEVVSSTGNLSPNLIVRSSITLTCTVASGAKSIEWLKDSTVLTEGTDYEKVKVEASGSSDLVSKIEFDIASDSAGTYKCRGTQYDDFCATQRQFESEGVVLTIITATPLENPADATAYGGGSHTFTCRFPNPFVGQSYEIVWSFKGAGDSVAQPMIGNGDVYENGERIIDGTISKDHTTTSGEITTELAVANVDTNVAGEYICTVKWGTIFIKSNPATLTVRAISEPPMTTNVAKGGEAKFTCKTTGDAEGTITFHKAADDTVVGSVVATPVTVAGVVTTTGVLTIAAAADSDSFEYYCKATWSGTEVKSGNVYLAVIGITATTPTAWGVNSKSAQFECKSDAILKKNAAGDALLDADGDDIRAAATITWEYYDTATTTWKATNEDNRFNIMSSLIGSDGIRVSPLSLRNLNSNEDGLKVRCNIAYVADADNRFFGATVTSTDMILKIAQISSVAASNIGPVTGETITLTCIAVGESAPTFMFTTGGKSSIDNTFFQEVEALAVSSDGTTHTAKYVTKAIAPNVLRNGEVITCEADYGISLGTSTKDLTVTTYYDCSSVTVKSLNPDGNGATVNPTDNGDGTLTQTITCPADTESARFVLMPTSNSAASITCSKSTGKYTPAFLARCKETRPFTSGYGKQLMGLSTFPIKPCSATDPTATGEWSPEKMKEKLNSMADTVCGFRHKVPCLKNGQCTLDTDKSGCSYDHENEQLIMEYYVNLNTPVWTFTEKDSLVKKEDGVIKFWECSESYTKRRRREAMENGLDFESFEVVEKRSANETFAGDSESATQQSSHYVAATTVGVCAVVMVTALLTVLFVRLRRKQSQDIEAVELTNN
ncbi:hypothetical protein ACHWQZ_G016582 [Mnemiopsis leidyi]